MLYGIAKIIANSCSPKKTIKTQVVYKNIVETTQYNNNMPTGTSYEYYITFESETQKQFKMEVPRKIYDSILMGDVGQKGLSIYCVSLFRHKRRTTN